MGQGRLIQALKRDGRVIEVEIELIPLKVGGLPLTMAILNPGQIDWDLLYLMSFGFFTSADNRGYQRQHRVLPSATGRETGTGVAIRGGYLPAGRVF